MIRELKTRLNAEIIIVDGGSKDDTVQICEEEDVRVLLSKKGRGSQFRVGAQAASGDYLFFLHADTRIPLDAEDKLIEFFSNPKNMIGAFTIKFEPGNLILDLITVASRVDTVLTTFGDQGLFMRKEFYGEIGGFPDWPLFEDMKILQEARKRIRVHKIRGPVISSSRRFEKNGIVPQLALNTWLIIRYLLGAHPNELVKSYV